MIMNIIKGITVVRFIFLILGSVQLLISIHGVLGRRMDRFTIATYNIWNIMFHWEVRKFHIADMISSNDIDIIGFQEVRAHKDSNHNQLQELQELLPQHKYLLYYPINIESTEQRPPGWEYEGIGLLSRHKLLSSHIVNITSQNGEDTNKRALISAQFLIHDNEVTIGVTHFSYDRKQQCHNVLDIMNYLHSAGTERTILLGDFNAFDDFFWPLSVLMSGDAKRDGICQFTDVKSFPVFQGVNYGFKDAWSEVNPNNPGFTFSNMPSPGFINRPDRILVSKTGLKIHTAFTAGKGEYYANKYKKHLWWTRAKSVYKAAKDTAEGKFYSRTCQWDCGPHGSCRCGICVEGTDDRFCSSIDHECNECDLYHLKRFHILGLIFGIGVFALLLGVSCVIFKLLRPWTRWNPKRRFKYILPLITNKYVLLSITILMLVDIQMLRITLKDTLVSINGQLHEELYPSDHLMVVATIRFSYR